jgi:hypothetical protein
MNADVQRLTCALSEGSAIVQRVNRGYEQFMTGHNFASALE